MVKILGLSGSLRAASYNSALLRAAIGLVPGNAKMEIATGAGDLPLLNEDIYENGFPSNVASFREQFAQADAFVFATPEYNRSFSAVMKNAIDWLSRPTSPLVGKAALIVGAGPGALGTGLANYHLRQVLSICDCHVVPGREILVSQADAKFSDRLELHDEVTAQVLAHGLARLVDLSR